MSGKRNVWVCSGHELANALYVAGYVNSYGKRSAVGEVHENIDFIF